MEDKKTKWKTKMNWFSHCKLLKQDGAFYVIRLIKRSRFLKQREDPLHAFIYNIPATLTSPQTVPTFAVEHGQQRDDTEAIGPNEQARQQSEITVRAHAASGNQRGIGQNVHREFCPRAATESTSVTSHRRFTIWRNKDWQKSMLPEWMSVLYM